MPKNIEMSTDLRFHLEQGAVTAKELSRLMEKSESRIREILKDLGDQVVRTEREGKAAVFSLPNGTEKPVDDEPAAVTEEPTSTEPEAPVADPAPATEGEAKETCPLCGSDAEQVVAGPEGSFLGSAKTCPDCGKTWNVFSRQEVAMVAQPEKGKRVPLNPQYKINEKIDAVTKAGGKLFYDRPARQWVLAPKGKDPMRMSAKEFSVETAETIIAKL